MLKRLTGGLPFWCWLGWHTWELFEEWTPNMSAPIVTRWHVWKECEYCPATKTLADARFDPETGDLVSRESDLVAN
jgi:hypothetical protein